jgi:uroporphyrinogen decarboxylase
MKTTPLRQPDFDNLLAVLKRTPPQRPTLFEFMVHPPVLLPGVDVPSEADPDAYLKYWMRAFLENGYDFATVMARHLGYFYNKGAQETAESRSQNAGGCIRNWEEFEHYQWPVPANANYGLVDDLGKKMPSGMKLIAVGPSGILENMTDLMTYEEMCYAIMDEPDLVKAVSSEIGQRHVEYYSRMLENPHVGAILVNDDWGFKTQTLISPTSLREFIIPWHREIVKRAHAAGKPAILHSCGNPAQIWDDIIEGIGYDGKHSYEDGILPVEEAYREQGHRIAIMGGIDVDFLARSTPPQIAQRCRNLLEQSRQGGGYALGSGNSVTKYIPRENYLAMRDVALFG